MRLPSIDLLRLVVVAVIVWRHTWPAEVGEHQLLISSVSVPFFFFLTGWLWRTDRRDVRGEVTNRWLSLGVPYIAWLLVIYGIAIAIFSLRGQLTLWTLVAPFLGGSYARRPFTTFWFFTSLAVVAVGMRVLDRASTSVLIVVTLGTLTLGSFAGSLTSRVPLAVGTGVACLSYAVAARALREAWPSASKARSITAAAIFVVAVPASIPLGWLDIKYGYFGTPYLSSIVAIAVTWAVIVLLDAAFAAAPKYAQAIQPALSYLAPLAIVVVLIHPAVLFVFDAPSVGAAWWVYPCALLIPFAAALLIARTPARKLFIGART